MRGLKRRRSGSWLEVLACDPSCDLSDEAEPDGAFLTGKEVFEAMIEDVGIVREVNEEYLRDLAMSEVVVREIAVNCPWWSRSVGWLGIILMSKLSTRR